MSLAQVKTAVNSLYKASVDKGNNKAKRALIQTAYDQLGLAIADGGSPLTAPAKVLAKAAQAQALYAMNMEDNTMNGSTVDPLNPKRGVEYAHVDSALASATAALTA